MVLFHLVLGARYQLGQCPESPAPVAIFIHISLLFFLYLSNVFYVLFMYISFMFIINEIDNMQRIQ